MITERLEESWERIDAATNQIRAMCSGVVALMEGAPREASETAVPHALCDKPGFTPEKQLLSMIAALSDDLWCEIDGDFSSLRSSLGIRDTVEHEEARNG
ncbi:MAG: hypothetical protein CFE40_05495 [Burkholderiales bacterium PBB1]|nr:MAG: hypothetical protein CFE40_05495 [Burkholderiales bacterium PBB1]